MKNIYKSLKYVYMNKKHYKIDLNFFISKNCKNLKKQ